MGLAINREQSSSPSGLDDHRRIFSIQGEQPIHMEEQPCCGLNWAASPPTRPEESGLSPVPPELNDVQVALDDDPDEETPRPGGVRESGLCLLLSGSMHFLIIALLLYFTSYASGLAGMPGPGVGNMMVGLYEGLGDPLEDGDGEVGQDAPGGSEESAEAEPETAELPPEPELASLDLEKIADPPEPDLIPPEPEPDPEAIALEQPKPKPEPKPEPKKTPPPKKVAKKVEPKPKAAAPAAKKSESVGQADQAGSGRGTGTGRGIGAGAGGGGGGLAGYRKANFNHIVKLIQRRMVYPPEVKKAGITGTAKVAFTIGRNGHASNIRLAASSGNGSLDQAALSAVKRASPFPAPPEPAHITIPLRFSLR